MGVILLLSGKATFFFFFCLYQLLIVPKLNVVHKALAQIDEITALLSLLLL